VNTWLTYFQHNRMHRRPLAFEQGITVEPHLRDALIRSLQRFQIGETGEGLHLKQGAAATGDAAYAEAIALFIAEEQQHAQWLAQVLTIMGTAPLTGHWSDNVFRVVRHLMGLQVELVVLLSAEMIAKRYYRALYEGTQEPLLRELFAQICEDEEGHIAFHCAFLQTAWAQRTPAQRWFVHHAWRAFYQGVCLVVAWDHRSVLHAVGLSPHQFLNDCNTIFTATMATIFGVATILGQPTASSSSPRTPAPEGMHHSKLDPRAPAASQTAQGS
jgi:bacterioferritin (cytochrome b1)